MQTGFPLPPQSILSLSLLLPRHIIHASSCTGQKWSSLPWRFSFVHIPHESISKSCGLNVYNRSHYGRLPPPQPSGAGTASCHRDHCRGLPGRPTPRAANSGRTAARFYLFMLSRITSLICSKSAEASLPSQSVRPKVLQRAINVLYDLWWLRRPLADRPLELQMRASASLHLLLP